MNHFLDIHKTDAAALRGMIDSAHAMKTARNGRPKGTPDDDQPLAGRMVALMGSKRIDPMKPAPGKRGV